LEDDRFIQSGFIKIISCWKRISIPHATKKATIYRLFHASNLHTLMLLLSISGGLGEPAETEDDLADDIYQ